MQVLKYTATLSDVDWCTLFEFCEPYFYFIFYIYNRKCVQNETHNMKLQNIVILSTRLLWHGTIKKFKCRRNCFFLQINLSISAASRRHDVSTFGYNGSVSLQSHIVGFDVSTSPRRPPEPTMVTRRSYRLSDVLSMTNLTFLIILE